MIGFFTRSDKTMSANIARHSRLRSERVALERHHEQAPLVLHYPVLVYYRWREKSAVARLVSSTPANAGDARDKLIYLMALMTSNTAALPLNEVQAAIRTLQPFRSGLAEALGCRKREGRR